MSAAAVCASAAPAGALGRTAEPAGASPSAVIAFAPVGERALAALPGMSVGIMSASQGHYSRAQLLLDISQGARVASSAYPRREPPALTLSVTAAGASIEGWPAAARRARDAPQILTPGLLASRLPGGAAYVGIDGLGAPDAAAAADETGHVGAVSQGTPITLAARVGDALSRRRLAVVDVSPGAAGHAELLELSRRRARGELLIVVQRAGAGDRGALLWVAAAGLARGGGRELTSQSTNERGLLASFDLTASILRHAGAAGLPSEVRGKPIEAGGRLQQGALRTFMARLRVVGGRRLPAFGFLLCAWLVVLLLALLGARASARARAMRVGALAVLWAPVAVLIPAAFAPSAAVEYLVIALSCTALGALSDVLLPWPRAMLAPAVVGVLALSVDALAHTQLLVRSLLGPNPILGARFYGIGNEVKSGLAVLVLAAVAGGLYPGRRGRRGVAAIVTAGVVLAIVEGSARIGAGVGGVILVSAGFAVAAAMLIPGDLTRRRAVVVLLAPPLALVALAALDLLTAHGGGHYTGSVLHASSAAELRDVLVRRYRAAWGELRNHAMPVATALALACAVLGLRARARLLAPVAGDPAWAAALAGGLVAGIVGAFSEDSGPVLLVVAVFALVCVASYLWGRPPAPAAPEASSER